eukprot:1106602-Prorocentrum_lima.AAC.1
MTSSLVGSEMCIRDSPSTSGMGIGGDKPLGFMISFTSGRTSSPLGIGAVSYTHLTLPTICSV